LVMPRLVPRRPSAQKKGNELTGAQVFFKRARRDREDAAKDRRAGEATAKARRAGEIELFEQIKKKKDRKITKKDRKITKATAKGKLVNVGADPDVSGLYEHWEFPDLMSSSVRKKLPWNWKKVRTWEDDEGEKTEFETGIPFLGNIIRAPAGPDDEFVGMNKKGGQIKKSVKKVKARKGKSKVRKGKPKGVGVAQRGYGRAMPRRG